MRVRIVTPAPRGSTRGNRVTADRWAAILRSLGHRVDVEERWSGGATDVLVALHARKSAASVRRFRRERPRSPIVVGMAGTDLYPTVSRTAREALALADRIVVLQPAGVAALPKSVRRKARAILQSAPRLTRRPRRADGSFAVCVLGHLRPVKDPFRPALALRRLPARSRAYVVHAGAALTKAAKRRARREARANPRWRWIGETSRDRARRILAGSRLVVLPSKTEGGANVISEALAVGTPILASRIPGTVGILGADYPGYFRVGDTAGLARLLWRAESDPRFYAALRRRCAAKASLVRPARERRAWAALLREVVP